MKLVIFDFDGVLANTLEFAFEIHKEKNPNFTWDKFQDFSNGSFIDGYKNAVEKGVHVNPSDYKEKYEKELNKINIHDALHKAVLSLSKNYILTIVSSTITNYIKNFLLKENLQNYFSDVLGVDVNESKTIKINSIIKKYNILPEDIIFITDTLGDVLEGNECGVKSIGVTWGLHDRKTLEKGNPIAIIDDPRDLLKTIKNVL